MVSSFGDIFHSPGCRSIEMQSRSHIHNESHLLEMLNDPKQRDAAFGAFYDAYSRQVYTYALRMTACVSDACDVTQETFIRVHAHLLRGNTISDPLPFCLMIARQRVLNMRRDHKETVEIDEDHLVADPYPEIFSADIAQHLERVISDLPLLMRDAFLLRYYDGLSYEKIAEMISESSGTVRMRVQRAKTLLRRKLAHLVSEVRR
ncbi:MAG: RNA polymerase sigma factor [Candidatus Kapabacteria bacterium]|nr:RNA polymerase sigma factor [Candidatus Kapabacteria bacterium]